MGNIHSAVLERATRSQETSEEEMRTLRYAVREELKNLAEDPSKRTLYRLLHTNTRRPLDPPSGAPSGSGAPSRSEEAGRSGEENSSLPGSPRLIIDETVDPQVAANQSGEASSQQEAPPQGQQQPPMTEEPGKHRPPQTQSPAAEGTSEPGTPPRPRMGSMGQGGMRRHPKKMFLEDYRNSSSSSGGPSEGDVEARSRTASFSAGPAPAGKEDFRNRAQSVSAVYSLKKRAIAAAEQAKQGDRVPGRDEPGMKTLNIRTCINAILESQMVRNRLKVPPDDSLSSEDSPPPPSHRASPAPLKPQEMQSQVSQALKPESGGEAGEGERKPAMGEVGIHGPLLMLAAQVDSMRPLQAKQEPPADPASRTPDPSTPPVPSVEPPQPPKHHAVSPRLEPAEEPVPRRAPEPERYPSQRVATIRPITQPPRHLAPVATPPPCPSKPADRSMVEVRNPFEDTACGVKREKMPGLVPHPQQQQQQQAGPGTVKAGAMPQLPLEDTVRYYEQTYREMLTKEIQKVYAQEFSRPEAQGGPPLLAAQGPTGQPGRLAPPTVEVLERRMPGEVRFEERAAGPKEAAHWPYQPQTAQEREDIIRESRRTLTFHEEAHRSSRPEFSKLKPQQQQQQQQHFHRDRSPLPRDRSPLVHTEGRPAEPEPYSHLQRAGSGTSAEDAPLDLSAKSSTTTGRPELAERQEAEWKSYAAEAARKSPMVKASGNEGEHQPGLAGDARYPPPPHLLSTAPPRPPAPGPNPTMVYLAPGALHPRHAPAGPGPARPQIRAMIQQQQQKGETTTKAPGASSSSTGRPPHHGAMEVTARPPPQLEVRGGLLAPPPPGQGPPPGRVTVSSLLGDHSPSDILYLRCNLCASTYGSLHAFRKHFSKAHGHDPSAEHITIQTISATKDAIDRAKGEPPSLQQQQQQQHHHHHQQQQQMQEARGRGLGAPEGSLEKQQALENLNLLPSNQYYESQLSRYKHDAPPPASSPPAPRRSPAASPISNPAEPREGGLRCPQCSQEFSTRDWGVFRRHVRGHEGAGGEGLSKCSACRDTLQDEQQWRAHLAMAHTCPRPPGPPAPPGPPHLEALPRSQHSHLTAPEAEYRCHYCAKSFVHESGLIVHMQEHASEILRREQEGAPREPTGGAGPREQGVATMYARRMSFSEHQQRDLKRPASRDTGGEEPLEQVKRPRSGSFPNALDFLERKVEFEHKRLLVGDSPGERSMPQKVLKLGPSVVAERPARPSEHPHRPLPAKRGSQDMEEASGERRRGSREEALEPKQKNLPTARSLIDEMVETAVSELAASPNVTPSPPLKILPRLFKGDPMEKVWMHEGRETGPAEGRESSLARPSAPSLAASSSRPSPGGSQALEASTDPSMEHLVKQAMLSVPFLASKKHENVKNIIESLVTMEISMGTGNPQERRGEASHPTSPPSAKDSAPHNPAPKKPGEKMETIRETISQAIENSISHHIGSSHEPQEEPSVSRLRQLMTEKPQVAAGDPNPVPPRDSINSSVSRPSSGAKPPSASPPREGPLDKRADSEEGKEGAGLQSMREIYDQIIAKYLSNSEMSRETALVARSAESLHQFWGKAASSSSIKTEQTSQAEATSHTDTAPSSTAPTETRDGSAGGRGKEGCAGGGEGTAEQPSHTGSSSSSSRRPKDLLPVHPKFKHAHSTEVSPATPSPPTPTSRTSPAAPDLTRSPPRSRTPCSPRQPPSVEEDTKSSGREQESTTSASSQQPPAQNSE